MFLVTNWYEIRCIFLTLLFKSGLNPTNKSLHISPGDMLSEQRLVETSFKIAAGCNKKRFAPLYSQFFKCKDKQNF
jgi:hypothetical protein